MKKITSCAVIILLCLTLGGCYDSNDVTDLAFIIAIGIDTAEDEMYEFTFQSIKPSAFGSNSSGENPLISSSVMSHTIYDAMDIINTNISEKCDYSQLKLVVFSKSVLKNGIEKPINAMLKSNDFHPNIRIAMSETTASEYLKKVSPSLDTNPAEYYENIFKNKFSTFSPDAKLKDFEKTDKNNANVVPAVYVNGKIGLKNELVSDNVSGMAILNNYKLIDTANPDEVFIYRLITDRNFRGNYYVTMPDKKENIVIEIIKKDAKYNLTHTKNGLSVLYNIALEGDISWSEYSNKYLADDLELKKFVEQEIKNGILNFMQKCSSQYKTDILNIAKKAKPYYLTVNAWENENWQYIFESIKYNANAEISIKREGINLD
ncbi:MAG: Ger(x)C family spore germination protein [Clostridia bacterium]|nr:Ger(x)C family spore germination protein [Clostridia bacterium]